MNRAIRALVLVAALAGCTPSTPALHPTRAVVQVRDVVRVALTEIDNDTLAFTVWNHGTQAIEVDRDAVLLDTDHGPRRRRSDDEQPRITVSPGASRVLSLRFDWTGLRDTTARVLFDNAIRASGRPVDVSAIEIRVE